MVSLANYLLNAYVGSNGTTGSEGLLKFNCALDIDKPSLFPITLKAPLQELQVWIVAVST